MRRIVVSNSNEVVALSDMDTNTIILIIVSIPGAILSGVISRYGFSVFRRKKTLHLKGKAFTDKLINQSGEYESYPSGDYPEQTLDDIKLNFRGDSAKLSGAYCHNQNEGKIFNGVIKGEGHVKDGAITLLYEIRDHSAQSAWHGSMVVIVPGSGVVRGSYILESMSYRGKIAVGRIVLERQ